MNLPRPPLTPARGGAHLVRPTLLWTLCCLAAVSVLLAHTLLGNLPLEFGGAGLLRGGAMPLGALMLAGAGVLLRAAGREGAGRIVGVLLVVWCGAWLLRAGAGGGAFWPAAPTLALGLLGLALCLPRAPAAAVARVALLLAAAASIEALLAGAGLWWLVDVRPVAAMLAGAAVLATGGADQAAARLDRSAVVMAVGGGVLVVQVWLGLADMRQRVLRVDAQAAARESGRLAERAVQAQVQALGRLADRLARSGGSSFESAGEAQALLRDLPELEALAFEQDGVHAWHTRAGVERGPARRAVERILSADPQLPAPAAGGRYASVHFGADTTVVEVRSIDGDGPQAAVLGSFGNAALFGGELAHLQEWFELVLLRKAGPMLWHNSPPVDEPQHAAAAPGTASAFGGQLQVSARPSAARVRQVLGVSLPVLLSGGLLIAFVAALTRQLAQEARHKERELAAQRLSHAEERRHLEEVQRQLVAAVASMSEGFMLLDARGCIQFVNGRAAELAGRDAAALIGRAAARCFPRPSCPQVHALCVRALHTGQAAEEEFQAPDEGRWLHVRVHPLDGRLAICASDASARIVAEQELRSAQEENRLMLDNSLDAICILDSAGRFVRANAAVSTMWGYAADELTGTSYLDLVAPEDVLKTMMTMSEVMAGQPTRDFENRILGKDGRVVSTMWSANWSATMNRVFCVARDLSSRRMKDQLAADQHRILSRVASGMPLHSVLEEVALMLESQMPGMRAAIGRLDGRRATFSTLAAPGLAPDLVRRIDAEASDGGDGIWAQVIAAKAPVFTEDMRQDPLWSRRRELAELSGAQACWCAPAMGQDDEVLGLLMLWHEQPSCPDVQQTALVAVGTQLAGVAIQHWVHKQALSESEQRFRSLFEHNPAAVFALDTAGRIVEVNGSSSAMLGYGRDELVGASFGKVVPGWTREPDAEGVRPASSTREVLACHSSGALRELSVTVVPTRVGGHVVGYYAVAYDVTGAKQNLRRLRLHAQVIAGTHDAIALVDLEGRVVDWNGGASRLFGTQPEHAVGRALSAVVNGDDRARLTAAIEEVARERQQGRELELATAAPGRALRHMVLTLSYLGELDDVDPLIVIYGLDITQRKAAENAIRESHAFFRLSSEMFCTADPDGWLRQVNEAFVATLGHDERALLSTPFLEFVHPEDRGATAQAFDGLRRDGSLRAFVNRLRHRDGSYRWIEWGGSVDAGGTLYAVARDVTERRAADAAFQRLLQDLKSTNRELEDFAFVASHDLQEPLRKVLAFSDRLRVRHRAALAGEGIDYLDRLDNAARRMQRLISDLLAYSRVSTRQRSFERVDLTRVVQAVLSDLESSIERSGAVIEVGELGELQGDAGQLEHVLLNLLSNAIKFARPGEPPHVRVYCRPELVAAAGSTHALPHLALHVEDEGIGFEQQHAERIFMPFQRLHGRDVYEGTGIGLAIVRKIAARHRAGLEVSSTPGKGTHFVLRFPVQQPDDAGPAASTSEHGVLALPTTP